MLLPVAASLSCIIVLATGVAANPIVNRGSQAPISLPITKKLNTTGRINFVQRDQERLRNLAKVAARVTGNEFSATTLDAMPDVSLDDTGVTYTTNIGIGNPPTYYDLIIDTGSSNTWLGANQYYKPTDTSVKTGNSVSVTYGAGFFKGHEYEDTVTIAPGVTISQQSIGVAHKSSRIKPHDGILGIGPQDLTLGTLNPDVNIVIPTVTDNLLEQGKITQGLVSVSFEATDLAPVTNGELTFGSTDSTKYTGNINYVSITDTFPSNLYWGVNASFHYGEVKGSGECTLLKNTAGIVDTGTTLLYIATHAYKRYIDHTGAVYDDNTGLLRVTEEQYKKLRSLFLDIGGHKYELVPNAQIWPRALNEMLGGERDHIYLVMQDIGHDIPGLEFIAGMVFLERFYSVYDTENHRLGLAPTQFTKAETN